MDRLTVDDIEPWFMSGKPVVRFVGKDYSQSTAEYTKSLTELAEVCGLGLALLEITEPPAVIVQTYLPKNKAPELVRPALKVSKATTPWLFCIFAKCRVRVSTPGMLCKAHEN